VTVSAARRDYLYSDPMRTKGGVWNAKALDDYLANPQAYVPRNDMDAIAPDPTERQAIISYLETLK